MLVMRVHTYTALNLCSMSIAQVAIEYSREMNRKTMVRWLEAKLIPKLPPKSVLVTTLPIIMSTSRKHLRTKVTPDFHLTYSKKGRNLGSESK